MKNENNNESKKMVLGLVIVGLVGAGVVYCMHNAKSRKTPVLQKIGKTISEVGEMLEHSNLSSAASDTLESLERKLPDKGEVISNLADWVSTGLTLWKHFKKG